MCRASAPVTRPRRAGKLCRNMFNAPPGRSTFLCTPFYPRQDSLLPRSMFNWKQMYEMFSSIVFYLQKKIIMALKLCTTSAIFRPRLLFCKLKPCQNVRRKNMIRAIGGSLTTRDFGLPTTPHRAAFFLAFCHRRMCWFPFHAGQLHTGISGGPRGA